VEEYRLGFATLDAERLLAIWDPDYDVVYSPVELVQPVRGGRELDRYFRDVTQGLGRVVSMDVGDVTIDVLGDVAYAERPLALASPRGSRRTARLRWRSRANGWCRARSAGTSPARAPSRRP
jgi:hypothetical protein